MNRHPLPEPTFTILVAQICTPAMVQLGLIPDPISGEMRLSLKRARFSMGLLDILVEKTKGNLSPAEELEVLKFQQRLEARWQELEDQGEVSEGND